MNTNVLPNAASPEDVTGEPRGLLAALSAAIIVALTNWLRRKADTRPDMMSRAELCAELREISERIHADHLALLEKLDANHRELLAALERQAGRINALECGLARVDERTKEEA
jgi:hypothetical protein